MRVFAIITCAATLIVLMGALCPLHCHDDGGMLCGNEDEKPRWIFRFEVIDNASHMPIRDARIKINMDSGNPPMVWETDQNGFAILVAASAFCIPENGNVEVSANGYEYINIHLTRSDFIKREDRFRILMEGHNHQWVDMNLLPETSEIMEKIAERRYRIGISQIQISSGYNLPNYAPACFEYEIELKRIDGAYEANRNYKSTYTDRRRTRNEESNIPSVRHNGRILYIFPNDLSYGPYYWMEANQACLSLNRLGYDDWRLPTKEELNTIYVHRKSIGGFTEGWYWSASRASSERYWLKEFGYGDNGTEYKGSEYNVNKGGLKCRCVRDAK